MGAKSKRAKRTRHAAEFDVARIRHMLTPPKGSGVPLTSWTLAEIFAARDAQMRGDFLRPARMAESMRTNYALAVALDARLAPQRCLKTQIVAAKGARGESIAAEGAALYGDHGIGISADTKASIHACLVTHEIAFAQCVATPREDGSRVDFELQAWPIEHVRWDVIDGCYKTRVDPASDPDGLGEIPIVHGDGRWIIFQRFAIDPHKHAAILAAAIVWASLAYALRDWAKSSVAHGSAKVIGALPAGVSLQDENGNMTEEASAMAELLRAIASSDSPVGIKPAGSEVDFLTNNSTAWQIFHELVNNGEKAAARIYLGTDGVLGATGGAPGVDIQALFGVAATKVEGDLACLSRGFQTLIDVWTAVNFGDSSLAPRHRYMLPDADADAARASEATRTAAFYEEIKLARANGFDVAQAFVDKVAERHGISAPTLPIEAAKGPSITLAPTDVARVISVNEARASTGLGPLLDINGVPDPAGRMTVEEYAAKKAAEAAAPVAPAA